MVPDVATEFTGEAEVLTAVDDLPSGLSLLAGGGLVSRAHVREEIQGAFYRGLVDVRVSPAGFLGDLTCGQLPSLRAHYRPDRASSFCQLLVLGSQKVAEVAVSDSSDHGHMVLHAGETTGGWGDILWAGRGFCQAEQAGFPACAAAGNVTASGTQSAGFVTPLPHAYKVQKSPDGSGPTGDHSIRLGSLQAPQGEFCQPDSGRAGRALPKHWTRIGGGGSGGEPK